MKTNRVHIGDVRELAKELEPASIQTLISSPPYWRLRSYLAPDHPDKAKEIGSEPTVDEYIRGLVGVFAALRPALKPDATCWINLGDSYLPDKNLALVPFRFALAMRDDGWVIRSDIIYSKPNPMPESVTDRPTRAHEYIFLLSKSPRYFYDATAIAEAAAYADPRVLPRDGVDRGDDQRGRKARVGNDAPARNKRSVWTVTTAQFPDAHYATFAADLIRPCILAGTSERGECSACGRAWVRVVERPASTWEERKARGEPMRAGLDASAKVQTLNGKDPAWRATQITRTTGWRPQCRCDAPTRPQTVLDPFLGSGTVAEVAVEEGRRWIGCDLDERARRWTADRLARLPVGRLAGV